MRTIFLFYAAFAAAWVAFFVTQIVIPAIRGTKIFPFFRSDELRAAEAELVNARENYQTKVANQEVWRLREIEPASAPGYPINKNRKKGN